jgi:hypothetical protein
MEISKLEKNLRNSKKWKEAEERLDKFNKTMEFLKERGYLKEPIIFLRPYAPWKLGNQIY